MPASFDSFGLKFLYPDNWTIAGRAEDEGDRGVTFELPTGGFFSIESIPPGQPVNDLIQQLADSIAAEYGEVEREDLPAVDGRPAVEFRFYYLDLLVVSRIRLVGRGPSQYFVQMQAESRDFDTNEPVFAAILQQIAG